MTLANACAYIISPARRQHEAFRMLSAITDDNYGNSVVVAEPVGRNPLNDMSLDSPPEMGGPRNASQSTLYSSRPGARIYSRSEWSFVPDVSARVQ